MRIPLLVVSFFLVVATTSAVAQAPRSDPTCKVLLRNTISQETLREYVLCLPRLRARLRAQADSLADTANTTISMAEAAAYEGRHLRPVLYKLAALYPSTETPIAATVDSALAARLRWLSFVSQPQGEGLSGTIVQIELAMGATSAIAGMGKELVMGLLGHDPAFDAHAWMQTWEEAGRSRHELP